MISVTLFKSPYNIEQLKKLGLNDRQLKAVLYIIENGSITNAKYQELYEVSKPTATRDLTELTEELKLIRRQGITGAGTSYVLMGS